MAIIQNSKNMPINPMEIITIPKKQENHTIQKTDVIKALEQYKPELINQMNEIVKLEKDDQNKEEKNQQNNKISMSIDENENFIRIILNWVNWNELQYAIGNPNVEEGFHNELLKNLVNQIREIIRKEFPDRAITPSKEEEMSI
jgi:GTPase involved in cell partitioning and DNA repair